MSTGNSSISLSRRRACMDI